MRTLTLLLCILCFSAKGQNVISGKITDPESKESLPFVHLVSAKTRAISDIEGLYQLPLPPNISDSDTVRFSLVGYEKKTVSIGDLRRDPNVKLKRKATTLREFTVRAKEDPAYAMIRKAVERRKQNDPEELDKFRYRSYNKAYFDVTRIGEAKEALDSTNFKKAHFLMMESATEVTFEKPNKIKEKLLANQISGFDNPMISLQSNSFQPFSSYSGHLELVGFKFLNPISPNSDGSYIFQLEDSLNKENGKAYLISFWPKKNASGNLLEGSLTLDSQEWAIVTIQAKNSGKHNLADFEIRQQYTKVEGNWFPEQSSSRYVFIGNEPPVYVVSNTYIDSVDFEFDRADFSIANIEMDTEANLKSDTAWSEYRQVNLTENESNTYIVYDTLDQKIKNALNWTMNQSTSLANGRLAFGAADILLNRFFGFNQYEGFRLGLGLALNEKFIPWVSPEAYFAYGFRDKEIKYGGGLRFKIAPKNGLELFLSYENDVDEPGRTNDRSQIGFTRIGDVERDLFIRRMNPYEAYSAQLAYRPFRGLKTTARIKREERQFERNADLDADFEPFSLITTEVGLRLDYNPGESLMLLGKTLIPQGTSYPRITLDLSHAADGLLDSEQEFSKAEFRFIHQVAIRKLGALRLFASAGRVWADEINASSLMLNRGILGEEDLGIVAFGYFHTMPVYSFLNDRFVHLGLSQNLGNPFNLEWTFSKPEIRVMYQAAIGGLDTDFTPIPELPQIGMDRAYLEGGLIVDNIIRFSGNLYYSGFGLGVFHRQGVYATDKIEDNLAYAVSFAISF